MANNEGKVQKLLNNIKDNNKIDNVLTKDLDNQKKTLKDRLEQRKNKKLLSTSDCTEAIETIVGLFYTIIFECRKIIECLKK